MGEKNKGIKIRELISYIAKRKKPWAVAVFDKKTRKRAVGNTLPEVLVKMPEASEDLIVIDRKEFDQQTTGDDPDKTL